MSAIIIIQFFTIGALLLWKRKPIIVKEPLRTIPFSITSLDGRHHWDGMCYITFDEGLIKFFFDSAPRSIQVGKIHFFTGKIWHELRITYHPFLVYGDNLTATSEFTVAKLES